MHLTNPDTQVTPFARTFSCAEQANSMHAATLRSDGSRLRDLFARRRR